MNIIFRKMKKFILMLAAVFSLGLCSCSDDAWGNDNEEMANIYYFGFQEWGYDSTKKGNNNVLSYDVTQGSTVGVPMQFWCEFVRNYDVTTFYWITVQSGDLVLGQDYQVVDANGSVLTPGANGAYSMLWPNAKKGVQTAYIKALNGKTGKLRIQTFDPNSSVTLSNQDVASTIQSTTNDYEVRIFTQNWRADINIK